ncbi:serine/threonine-protein phosphatase 6 regulatory subunit 2-like isoform X1 [Conger conger]|uniref:serine/threonine-protein phosphatase 6 regulatory subunit 2-like isoform X1 n=2 Tax=Conger conger TaxID=82655 RepID=UPI002A5A29F2|nr:serine/threonine-protein phosphatase 6 regulatory subunit 2-like isoform X1 [Conger conger]XP_061084992.1 serine/threonine-protein phosphatase 6 regulatory subunit 2-like isoform X1 [Conger conger]
MFWKFDLHTSSHIDKLLDKDDVTLRELMEEEDVLQECKAQNRRLLLFLSQEHCMRELVHLVIREPPEDVEEEFRFKFPNVACELLTSDASQINDKLGGDETLLETLYSFLEQEPPLNPLLASFFSKTVGNLIARKTEQVIAFLRKKDGFIGLVLKHMDTSAMMDLILRLISCVEPAPLRQEVLVWLNEERLTQRLVELNRAGHDEERQSNAAQTLCDMIRLSRDQALQYQETPELDPLLAVLESPETVEELLKTMFEGEKNESCILNGTQVLLTLLETRRPGVEGLMDLCSQGFERSYTVNSGVLRGIQPHLKDFHQVLLDPPKKSAILTTIGVLEEPLGNARLHIARLVASLLQSSTGSISQELCRLNTMAVLLDLFFKYTWNNFLHFQVELCVAAVLSHSGQEEKPQDGLEKEAEERAQSSATDAPETSGHGVLVAHLFQNCRLVQRILDAWEENDKIQAEGGMRRGYMGHLTRIANTVVQNMAKGPVQAQISNLIKELPEDCRGRWESFVDETLTETNRRNTVDLVSTHNLHSSSEDDDMEGPFPNELSLQQAFSDYQIQQMTANFVDQFGFNDEEFAEHDENINATFDRIAEINFNVDADDISANSAAFEACCKERIQQFDDNEEEEDIWEDKEINYATKVKSRMRFGVSRTADNSPRSDVENGEQDRSCDSDEEEEEEEEEDEEEGPTDPTITENNKNKSPAEGNEAEFPEAADSGWTAGFEDLGNAQAPAPCVVVDVGSSVWDTAARQNSAGESEDKGWATFSDFQPFCCSESGPRCSSPVGMESPNSEGCPKQTQDKNLKSSSPCAWNVCASRKAPLVASDSSSSGGSDSEEEEEKSPAAAAVVTATVTAAGAGKEAVRLAADAKNEKAAFKSSVADSVPMDKLSITDGPQRGSETPNRTEAPSAAPLSSPAPESRATNLTVTDRKGETTAPVEPSLNGPV